MTYSNGYITVPNDGAYYVYAQLLYRADSSSRKLQYHYVAVNGVDSILGFNEVPNSGYYASVYTGRIINLQKGDKLSVRTARATYIYYQNDHSFFGAFQVA